MLEAAIADSPPPSTSNRKGRLLTFWTTLPGILTGAAALITAVVGLLALFDSGEDKNGSAPTQGLAAPRARTTATTVGNSSPKTKNARASGRLVLRRGDNADLESGVVAISPSADLIFGPESTPSLFATANAFLAPTRERVHKRSCETALAARHDASEILPQLDTQWICVSTAEGHVAVVRVVRNPGLGGAELVLWYIVWA